ncbi:MAG: DNA-binding response regulator [Coxiella sp. (in: Bacteria)]|nr:MAG: DNA-binding response regulator [Coxiella sp. (in: g-proteobacteria)]
MNDAQHILIVDDDAGIRDLLGQFLEKHGFITSLADGGVEMWPLLEREPIQLIILDIMMPGKDGMTLCKEIRQKSQIPIIMLTAICEDVDRIVGLEMGADDYLSKPFNPRELLARVKAILRRSGVTQAEAEDKPIKAPRIFSFAGWSLNKVERRLYSPESTEISLSTGEYNLLLAFLERPHQVLSRDQLLDLTRNRAAGPYDRSVDIQISRLRHKIEENHKSPKIIKTVRGGGYVLSTEVEVA